MVDFITQISIIVSHLSTALSSHLLIIIVVVVPKKRFGLSEWSRRVLCLVEKTQ